MDNFLKYWFHGFESSLEKMSAEDKKMLFCSCGKACSDSYSRKMYQEAFDNSDDLESFIRELKARFKEMDIRVIEPGKTIEIMYNYCACDLVREGYVSSPEFCECSRQSLLYNWGIFEDKNVDVEMKESILSGTEFCRFIITLEDR